MTAVYLKKDCDIEYSTPNGDIDDGWSAGDVIVVDKFNTKWLLDNMKLWRFATKEEFVDSILSFTYYNITNLIQLLREAGLFYEWLQLEPGDRFGSDDILERAADIAYKEGF